jgi:hypothetical protein
LGNKGGLKYEVRSKKRDLKICVNRQSRYNKIFERKTFQKAEELGSERYEVGKSGAAGTNPLLWRGAEPRINLGF